MEGQNTPSEDAIVVVQLQKMRRAKAEAASSNGEMRQIYSLAETNGVNLKAAKDVLRIIESKSEKKIQEFVSETLAKIRYLSLLGHQLTPDQKDLFDFSSAEQPLFDEKAYEEGLRAGRLGEDPNSNPHDLNTEAGQRWLEGFHAGTADRKAVLQMESPDQIVKAESEDDDFDEAIADEGDE